MTRVEKKNILQKCGNNANRTNVSLQGKRDSVLIKAY